MNGRSRWDRWRESLGGVRLAWGIFYLIVAMKIMVGALRLTGFVSREFGYFVSAATWAALAILVAIVGLRTLSDEQMKIRLLLGGLLIISCALLIWASLTFLGYLPPSVPVPVIDGFLVIIAVVCWQYSMTKQRPTQT